MDNKPKVITPMVPTATLFAVIDIFKEKLLMQATNPESVEIINDVADAVAGIVVLELNKE
jgi:hypothetical protein